MKTSTSLENSTKWKLVLKDKYFSSLQSALWSKWAKFENTDLKYMWLSSLDRGLLDKGLADGQFSRPIWLFSCHFVGFSFGWMCGFWAGFRILTFLQDFESKDDKVRLWKVCAQCCVRSQCIKNTYVMFYTRIIYKSHICSFYKKLTCRKLSHRNPWNVRNPSYNKSEFMTSQMLTTLFWKYDTNIAAISYYISFNFMFISML